MTDHSESTSAIPKISLYSYLFAALAAVICAGIFAFAMPKTEVVIVVPESLVNINTEPAQSLERLPRVGAKRAADIVKYRDSRRRATGEKIVFKNLADLDNVKGIGTKTLDVLKPYIRFE